jgi:hypothetical protein
VSWSEVQKLTASDGTAGDKFGWSLSLSDDVLAVVALDDMNYGISIYVFRDHGTSWVQEQKLTASDDGPGTGLTTAVSVSGNTLVTGAADALGYVFRNDGVSWVEKQKFRVPFGDQYSPRCR